MTKLLYCTNLSLYSQGFIQRGGETGIPPLCSIPPPPKEIYIIIEKSVQIINDDKYPLTFPRFVDASIDSPPKPKILYETLIATCTCICVLQALYISVSSHLRSWAIFTIFVFLRFLRITSCSFPTPSVAG